MRKLIGLALTLLCLTGADALAGGLYDDAVLAEARRKMGPNIELMVTEDIVRTIPRALRTQAAAIEVEFVTRGPHPLAFWSKPSARRVYVPMESVRFIDDLSILQSWFERRGCDAEYVQTYLYSLLREGRPIGSPLEAFGLQRNRALADHFVDDVSGKILKSSVLFILAHEVGHILLNHRSGLVGKASLQQEREADEFALDHFAAIGAPPAGMVIYFMALRWSDPVGGDTSRWTHPVSPDRIGAIAKRLAETPERFSFAEPNPALGHRQVISIAKDMKNLADLLADDRLLTIAPLGLQGEYPLSRLRQACPD